MSESNLHKHFRDDGNVPIPIPPADDSWKLMEQRLNEVMPVTHQAGGHTTPNSSGIVAKILPIVKYAVAAIFVSGVVLYSIHRINQPVTVPTPVEVSPIATKDSTTLATDTMADESSIVTTPDTTLAISTTSPAGANTPAASDKSALNAPVSTFTGNAIHPSATEVIAANAPVTATSATKTTTVTNTNNTTHTPAAGMVAPKAAAANKTTHASTTAPAAGNVSRHADATVTPASTHMASNGQPTHGTTPGRISKSVNQQKLKSGQQQPGDVSNALPPANNPEENNVAVVGLADNNHSKTAAMLKPGLPARLTLQQLPLHVDKASTDHPLKVGSETMDRLAGYRVPRTKSYTPGYWQLMAQWSVPLPVVSSPAYYKGPDGNTQLYRLAIPGIRVQRTWNNAALSLDVNAMSTQPYRNQPYYINKTMGWNIDWMASTLLQTFGYSASLAYHHRIAGNFFGAAGVQAYYGRTASILEVTQSHDSLGEHTQTAIRSEKSKVWNSISKFHGNITGEIYYDHARWQAAVRTAVPVLHTSRDSIGGNMKPVMQLELLLRWKINRRK
ncbi:hypothetical protein HHL17_06220 [Chitinophaga sp. G-6-1-13]|uniref:Uncharacterized protein n=1 Tax=Chitinophaga fulva TaxID=2728842 RepID=A0A848GLG4_9BACT|nr:hypothetical protein [Chitinophaga fulva]NML36788.1 hypothetical protein [Chitinophaga fulva]